MQPEASKPKKNVKVGENVLEHEEGILVIYEDVKKEKDERLNMIIARQTGKLIQKRRRRCLHPHLQKKTVLRSYKYLKPKELKT